MVDENGKAQREEQESTQANGDFEPTLKAFERDLRAMGPWTEEDERFFQIMEEEFGGSSA